MADGETADEVDDETADEVDDETADDETADDETADEPHPVTTMRTAAPHSTPAPHSSPARPRWGADVTLVLVAIPAPWFAPTINV